MYSKILALFLVLIIAICSCRNRCDTVTCFNNGICVQGKCECVEGFTGEDCSLQLTPKFIIVDKVEVTNFPCDSAGIKWDNGSCCPDLMAVIMNESDSSVQSTDYVVDAICNKTISTKGYNCTLSASQQYQISLYDYDDQTSLLKNTYMGCTYKLPKYSSHNVFPQKIILAGDSSGVIMNVYLKYQW